jgi:hypothetical protein
MKIPLTAQPNRLRTGRFFPTCKQNCRPIQENLAKTGRFPANRNATGLVDFSRLAREFAARFNKIRQKHGFYASIETLDAFRYGKINQPYHAFRYGKINSL